jgi:hypothetical protein
MTGGPGLSIILRLGLTIVTAYNDGVIPERLQGRVEKGRALAQLVVISPDVLEKKMAFLNAGDNSRFRPGGSLRFVLRSNRSRLAEIAKLLKNDPSLRLPRCRAHG